MRSLSFALVLCVLVASTCASTCSNPKVNVISTFSTQDATILTQLGHIGEFTLKCSNGESPSLFALFPCGRITPVGKVADNTYQISWTEEIRKSSGANVLIRLFDEDGYANLKKAQRDGENLENVKALTEITLTTKSAYKGPWVNAELIVAAIIGGIAYYAMTTKDKILRS